MVGRLEEFAFQQWREIRMFCQEALDLGGSGRAVMATEKACAPIHREEDIAGPLDLGKILQTRIDVRQGIGLTERMVKIR